MDEFGGGHEVIAHLMAAATAGFVPHHAFVVRREPHSTHGRWPIVFIHGCCGNGGTYWDVTPDGRPGWATIALAAGYVTYVVDLPGHGRAPQPPDFASMGLDKAVAAIQDLLAEVGPAVLVGHSMGGTVIIRTLAALGPVGRDSVAAAVLVDPARVAELNVGAPPQPGLADRLRTVADQPERGPHGAWYSDDLERRHEGWRGPESGRSFAEMVTAEFGAVGDPTPFAGVPSLLVAADPEFGIGAATVEGYRDQFDVPVAWVGADWGLPGHGHSLVVELGTDEIAGRLLDWLAAIP